jgi:hypothetical protein
VWTNCGGTGYRNVHLLCAAEMAVLLSRPTRGVFAAPNNGAPHLPDPLAI